MLTLAFDTSNSTISIALLQDQKLVDQILVEESGKQAEILILQIEKILQRHQIWYQDLHLLAATNGPGSFTGVRIGLAVARTLRIATNLPLVLINSLEALNYSQRHRDGVNFIAIDAKMNELFIASFVGKKNIVEPRLVKLEELTDFLPKTEFLALGSGKNIIAEIAATENLPYAIAQENDHIQAENVGLLALEKFHQKKFNENYDPLYLRDAKITQRKQ